VITFLHHFSQSVTVCIVISLFLLINDVRMTTFTHQLLSRITPTPEVWQCEREYSSRSTVYGVRRCVVIFHSTRRNVRHHVAVVTWCLAKTSYLTSKRDVAVTNGHCSRTVFPLTPPETQKLAAW